MFSSFCTISGTSSKEAFPLVSMDSSTIEFTQSTALQSMSIVSGVTLRRDSFAIPKTSSSL